jgi:hypothetical protein
LSENGREKTDDQVDCSDEEDGIGRVQVAVRYELRRKSEQEEDELRVNVRPSASRAGFPAPGSQIWVLH